MPSLNAMFLQNANATCNNAVFTLGTIPDMEEMHESAARLYAAAKALLGTEGKSALARLLNVSPQMVNNWEGRGVSEGGALMAQALIGCDANWVLTGEGAMLPGWPFPMIDPVRFYRLDPPGRSWVEARALQAIEDREGPKRPFGVVQSDRPKFDHPPEAVLDQKFPKKPPRKREA